MKAKKLTVLQAQKATEPTIPSKPSNILVALVIPTTIKIVIGIPSSPRYILPNPKRFPKSLTYTSVTNINPQQQRIWTISLSTGFLGLMSSNKPMRKTGMLNIAAVVNDAGLLESVIPKYSAN